MFVGLNGRYFIHLARHTVVNKLLMLFAVLFLISLAPSSISIMSAKKSSSSADYVSEEQLRQEGIVRSTLSRHSDISEDQINKLAKIIVRNAENKKLDPKLVASIIVVESRGIPTAISGAKSVGVMQIHVPTWGNVVDFTENNPFDPEVNVDLGTTILADYLNRYKNWPTALAAYEGSRDSGSTDYPTKVMDIYHSRVR
jgi:soluble lytic murein transglycosylase-like protein